MKNDLNLQNLIFAFIGLQVLLAVINQIAIVIREKFKDNGGGHNLILKELQILRTEVVGDFRLMQKTTESIERTVDDLKRTVDQKDKKWEDVSTKVEHLGNQTSGFETKLKSLEQSYVTQELRIMEMEKRKYKSNKLIEE